MAPIQATHLFPVHQHHGIVAQVVDLQHPLYRAVYRRFIVDITEILVQVFHRQYRVGLHASAESRRKRSALFQGNFGKSRHRIVRRNIGQGSAFRQMAPDHLAERHVFRIGIPPFAQRRVVIVTRRLRIVTPRGIGIRPVRIFEIGAAVEHIQTDAHPVFQHPFQLLCRPVIIPIRVRVSPYVEPGRIKFSDEVRTAFMETVDTANNILAHSSIDRRQRAVHITVRHLSRSVAGNQRHVEPRLFQHISDSGQVLLIVGIRAVFVFDLHHNDRPAVLDRQRSQLFAQPIDITFAGRQKLRILAPNLHILVFQQPIRITAEIPLGAHVRPRTEQYEQPFALRRADEFGQIGLPAEIEFARLPFMVVPEHIRRHGIQPHRLGPSHPVGPIFFRNTRIVHLSANQLDAFPVQQELAVRNLEPLAPCPLSDQQHRRHA